MDYQAAEYLVSAVWPSQVDFVLLGGDLFHDNHPSRGALVRAMRTLADNCLNDKPVRFQVCVGKHTYQTARTPAYAREKVLAGWRQTRVWRQPLGTRKSTFLQRKACFEGKTAR